MFTLQLFPNPTVLIQIGPLMIRYYALAYIFGLVAGWRLLRGLARRGPAVASPEQVDDYLTWATLGVVLGGRLGYVLFYQPGRFMAAPMEIFAVWQGGMSFHGGMLGVALATIWFCRRQNIPLLAFGDRVAVVTPIGLGFGRIANFVNGELWGRAAPDWLPWPLAMVFANGGPVWRYTSQLYQATLEGLVLLLVMWTLARRPAVLARPGMLVGVFLAGYAMARITGEFFREPDAFLGFLFGGITMGQLLSLPMLAAGLWLIGRGRR